MEERVRKVKQGRCENYKYTCLAMWVQRGELTSAEPWWAPQTPSLQYNTGPGGDLDGFDQTETHCTLLTMAMVHAEPGLCVRHLADHCDEFSIHLKAD